jgi:hypothetical protein
VPLAPPIHSAADARRRRRAGCPIRSRPAHRSLAAPRSRFAALRVLPRHPAPRHPPATLLRLASSLLRDGIPSRSAHVQTQAFCRAHCATICDAILELARFGKIEVNLRHMIALLRRSHTLRYGCATAIMPVYITLCGCSCAPRHIPSPAGGGHALQWRWCMCITACFEATS